MLNNFCFNNCIQLNIKSQRRKMDDYSKILTFFQLSGIIGLSYFISKCNKNINKQQQKINQLRATSFYTPTQAAKANKSQFYMKGKINKVKQAFDFKVDITYNQYYFLEPSNTEVIRQFSDIISFFSFKKLLPEYKENVFGTDGYQKSVVIDGQVVGDVFDIKNKIQLQKYGFLKKTWGFLAYYTEKFLHIFRRKSSIFQQGPTIYRPFLNGPKIGKIAYQISLAPSVFFIFSCKMQNGIIHANIIAKSKNQLISFLYDKINDEKKLIILFFFGIGCLISLMYPNICRVFRKIKRRYKNKQVALNIKNLSEQKTCIICYVNTRNLIMLNCKHLIMCQDCYEDNPALACPICKQAITDIKVINEIEAVE